MAEPVLLNPGPAGTSARVRRALSRGDLCHREPEFAQLLHGLRRDIPAAVDLADTHEAVVVTGSGTAAVEMAVVSAVRPGRALLVAVNGAYGERLLRIARGHGITAYQVGPSGDLPLRWRTPVDPASVASALAAQPDVDAVFCVHHETTTGLINPIQRIGAAVAGTGALFVVDAISGTGNEEQDLSRVNANVVCGTANKGLHGLPGISFLLCDAAAVQRMEATRDRGYYLCAATHLALQRRGEVAFTPAVQVCYAFDEALAEYFERGGSTARVALYRARAELVRAGFARLGLEPVVAPPHRANSVSTLRLPDGVTYARLHDELKARGYVIYAGQGPLAPDFFRICTFGEIPWERLRDLEHALGDALTAARG